MTNNWKRYKTSELIREKLLTIGDGYRATNSEMGADGIPFARAGNINDGFNFGTADLLQPASMLKAGEKISQSGDVVFTSKGTVGRFAFVGPETPQFVYSPQLCYWRSRNHEELNPRFLFYWIQGPASWSQISWAKGQTDMADYVSLRDQRESFWLDLPSPEEQRRIAHILGSLDDKIELNRQLNATLEQLARALFQSWFVDFDPVRAKASGEPADSICRRLGLTPELLALFPAALEDSAMGEIPVGWKVKPLPEIVTINPSRSVGKAAPTPYLDMANVPAHSARVSNVITRSFSSGSKFMNGDTLLARITPCLENGKTAYVDFLAENQVGWGSTEFIVLRPKLPLPTEFGYLLARHPAFRNFAIANMQGTSGRQRVPNNCFDKYFLAMPPAEVAVEFGKLVKPLMHQIKQQDEESRTLAALRDELLPQLLSGELRVSESTYGAAEASL